MSAGTAGKPDSPGSVVGSKNQMVSSVGFFRARTSTIRPYKGVTLRAGAVTKIREFLDRRVANAVSQLLQGEKNSQQIDQDEVGAERHPPGVLGTRKS